MTMTGTVRGGALALVISIAAANCVHAEKWPGKTPVPGGAVAAKVIGASCPGVLQPGDADELDAYIKRYLATIGSRDPQVGERLGGQVLPELERGYRVDYAKPDACTESKAELARDMLARVRAAANDATYWEQVVNPPVGANDAVYAKAIATVCEGTMAAAEVASLDQFVSEQMEEFAKTSSAADTATTWAYLRNWEKDYSEELRRQGACTDQVRKDAQGVLAKVAAARAKAK